MAREREQLEPAVYLRVFEQHPEGAKILEELVARFGQNPYVPGHTGDRDTAFNSGRLEVVNFILRRIANAQGVHDDGTISTLDERGG